MKLKSLLIAVFAGLFVIGCTTTQTTPQDEAKIKRMIVGTWHTKQIYPTRDGIKIHSYSTDTFYRNGSFITNEKVSYINRDGKVIGKMAYKRYFSWKVKGNKVITTFKGCKSRVIKRARTVKVEFVADIIKLACKYANLSNQKTSVSDTIQFIDRHKMVARNRIFTR